MNELAPSPSPVKSIPYGLMSLWDMFNFPFGSILITFQHLQIIRRVHKKHAWPNSGVSEHYLGELKHYARALRATSESMGLVRTLSRIDQLEASLDLHPTVLFTNARCAMELEVLTDALYGDAHEHRFYHYPLDKSKELELVDEKWTLVFAKFPEADRDIRDGIDCFALEKNTAAVFHMMRVAEFGLRAVASERRITLPKNRPLTHAEWGNIIRAMDAEVQRIHNLPGRGPGKDAALAFYSGAVSHARALKDKYRNGVMHANVSFVETEAADAIFHTRSFMDGLATRLSSTSRRQIKWKI